MDTRLLHSLPINKGVIITMRRFLSLAFCLFFLSGCQFLPTKFFSAEKKTQKAAQNISKKEGEIENKGKSFVFGAKYANEFETNRSAPILLSHDFLDLATMTLGPASLEDSNKIKDITDGLLNKAQKDLISALEDKVKAEKKLQDFVGQVVTLQNEKVKLGEIYDKKVGELAKVNEVNAAKAAKYDSENGLLASLNPFTDLWKFVKKLFVLSLIGGVLIVVFHLLEIFFPGLKILSFFGTLFGRIVMKLAPGVKNGLNLVSSNVYKTLKCTVKGLGEVMEKLKNYPIEQELVENYPDSYQFTKGEVVKVLEAYSEKINELIKKELDSQNDEVTRSIISVTKAEVGLKPMIVPNSNLI